MTKTIKSLLAIAIAAFAFTACSDIPEPEGYNENAGVPTEDYGELVGDGTVLTPFNIAAAIKKCKEVGNETSAEKYYIAGKVVATKSVSADEASFGNITFDLADDITSDKKFTCYQVMGSDGAKLPEGYTVNQGDEVIVYGPVVNFKNNTPETAGKGAAQIYSINGKKTDGSEITPPVLPEQPAGDGSEGNPFNIAAAIAKCKEAGQTATADKYYVRGIAQADATPDASYGNATIKMVDKEGETDVFTAYQVLGSDGKKMPSTYTIKKGDVVVVYGKLVNFKGNTPETEGKGAANIVTVNGNKTEVIDEGGEGGDGGEGGGGGTGEANYTKSIEGAVITLTHNSLTPSTTVETVDFDTYGWANAAEPTAVNTTNGTTVTCGQGEGSSTPKFYTATHGVRFYAKNTLTLASITKPIAKIVLTCDSYNGTDYVGNEQLYASQDGNTTTIVNDWTSASAGTQARVKTIEITYAQ